MLLKNLILNLRMVNHNHFHSQKISFYCPVKDNCHIAQSEKTNFLFIPVTQDIYRVERRFK